MTVDILMNKLKKEKKKMNQMKIEIFQTKLPSIL